MVGSSLPFFGLCIPWGRLLFSNWATNDCQGRNQIMSTPIITTSNNPVSMSQAITDLIESIAMQEASMSCILAAEAQKIQKALTMEISLDQLLNVNDTAMNMVQTINDLEHTLRDKLEFVSNNLYYPSRDV